MNKILTGEPHQSDLKELHKRINNLVKGKEIEALTSADVSSGEILPAEDGFDEFERDGRRGFTRCTRTGTGKRGVAAL